ncbi:hypothetical protein C8J57DRAFT_1501177 [Mycena rebaudengoi]|nr:hypothetical protein C8J57DRAFT_1501177 [Mycena rebaudengoi]
MSTPAAPGADCTPNPAVPLPARTPEDIATEAVTAQLLADTLDDGKKKRRSMGSDDISMSYRNAGRAFLRIGDPFSHPDDIVQHGIFVETTEAIDEPTMDEEECAIYTRNTESWELLWCLIGPAFRTNMINLEKKRKLRHKVCANVLSGMTGARGEDTNTCKKNVVLYLYSDKTVVDPPLSPALKINRGFNHPCTAALLCPASKPPVQATYDAILNGTLKITADMFPRFLYKDEWVYSYDPATQIDNIMDGIFEGDLMIKIAKCNLQGPSAALKPAGAHHGTRGNAAKIGVRRITPRLMAYFAFHSYLSLSSIDSYQQVDGSFDYKAFFWNIVGLFDDGDNAHILKHFNHAVFGDVKGNDKAPDSNADKENEPQLSDMARYKAQWAAKRAKRDTTVAATSAPSSDPPSSDLPSSDAPSSDPPSSDPPFSSAPLSDTVASSV